MKNMRLRVFEATPDVLQMETFLRRLDNPQAAEVTYIEAGRYVVAAVVMGFEGHSEAALFAARLTELMEWVEKIRDWSEVAAEK